MKTMIKTTLTLLLFTANIFAGSGSYLVPVDRDLQDQATFKMEDVSVLQQDDFVSLSYRLPQDLTGMKLSPVNFIGKSRPGKFLRLNGTFGKVICDREQIDVNTACFVQYNEEYKQYLEILDPQIEAAMIDRIKDPAKLGVTKQIWESFSGDPLGFVFFDEVSYGL